MSARERRKGAVAEREVVALLKDHGWKDARRTSDGRDQQTRGDVAGGPPGVHVEVKRQERISVPACLRQTIADANPLDIPVLVHRPSRQGWMATLPLEDLLVLLQLRDASARENRYARRRDACSALTAWRTLESARIVSVSRSSQTSSGASGADTAARTSTCASCIRRWP